MPTKKKSTTTKSSTKKAVRRRPSKKRTQKVDTTIAGRRENESDEEIQASIARMLLGIIAIAIFIAFILAPSSL